MALAHEQQRALLTRDQRDLLARVLGWSRTAAAGWRHDVYPNTWRSRDGLVHIRYDTADETLVVDRIKRPGQDPLRCRVALVPVESPEEAVAVLAALGHLPAELLDAPPDESWRQPEALRRLERLIDRQPPPPDITSADDDGDRFDGPASFTEAGQAFADLVDGRVMPDRAAEALSALARAGLIISVAYHDETTSYDAADDADLADVLTYPGVAR